VQGRYTQKKSNKLLKQAFAIAKSGNPYDETFVSVLMANG
jgi:hypothetical protein